MGDYDDTDETLEEFYDAALGFATRYPEFGLLAEQLRAAPPPPRVQGTPIIVSIRIGADPQAAVALACAARVRELALVIGEDTASARHARYLLDLQGRGDVQVVIGDCGSVLDEAVVDLIPGTVGPQSADVLGAVTAVCAGVDGWVRWVGCGRLTVLAQIHCRAPELAQRLVVSQTVGVLDDPVRAMHNLQLDPAATTHVISSTPELTLVMPDTDGVEAIAIGRGDELYQALAAPDALACAPLLLAHLDHWFDQGHLVSTQFDVVALVLALDLPLVELLHTALACSARGMIHTDPAGHPTWLVINADYLVLACWLMAQLTQPSRRV